MKKRKKLMTMAEIEANCNGEWVLIADPVTDNGLNISRGMLVCHSKNRDVIHRAAMRSPKGKRIAVLFIGRSGEEGVEFALATYCLA